MMQELKDKLHDEQCSLVVLHEGKIHTFDGRGVRTLYHLLDKQPEVFLNAKIADKAIGRSAARMMVEGGVTEVYAEVISERALEALRDANVRVSYGKKANHEEFIKIWEKLGEEID